MSRTVHTAQAVYDNEIIQTKLLREVEILLLFKTNVKLHFILWSILGRFQWYFFHKYVDEKRAYDFISNILIEDRKNILIVSHGTLM
ncbi:phosphoglycerate mutase family protein [Clostridium arbusti]|uniref:phosphoglycerate mutase family protein n=1 Tax=Clostridium arbusti TaxID=1137848 RepID=UPI0002882B8C|nr:phosphoglycerate mutase family protein [Clostridium arbusti]